MMKPCQLGILHGEYSQGGLLSVREQLLPYLRAVLQLNECWKVG